MVCNSSIWKTWWLLDLTWSRFRFVHSPTLLTRPSINVLVKRLYSTLDLRAKIIAVEGRFMYNFPTVLTVPSHYVNRVCWSLLFQDHPDRVCESDWIMRRVTRQKVQAIFVNGYIDKLVWCLGGIDGLQQHTAFVLVEEFRCLIDVVICSSVWTTYDHDCQT